MRLAVGEMRSCGKRHRSSREVKVDCVVEGRVSGGYWKIGCE